MAAANPLRQFRHVDGVAAAHWRGYDFPANSFVASFIGSPAMNFNAGGMEQSQDGWEFVADGGSRWPLNSEGLRLKGQRYSLGMRPEHLRLLSDQQGIPATIEVFEPTGSETQVHFRCGKDVVIGVFRERIDTPVVATVFLQAEASKVHLFDETTGLLVRAER